MSHEAFDGRPSVGRDKLLTSLYDVHHEPRADLVDLTFENRQPSYRLRYGK